MGHRKTAKVVIFLIAALSGLLLAARELAEAAPAARADQADTTAQAQSSLDFETYRTRIEPIFLKTREGGVRCYDCHSAMPTRLRLERLSDGASSWSEEQSRHNFKMVSGLVTPADPLKSRLLLHPLAAEAGGDPTHTGGKFWKSQDDPEWQTIAAWVRGASAPGGSAPVANVAAAPAPKLDFEFFRTQVQPVFLKKRPGVARCYAC